MTPRVERLLAIGLLVLIVALLFLLVNAVMGAKMEVEEDAAQISLRPPVPLVQSSNKREENEAQLGLPLRDVGETGMAESRDTVQVIYDLAKPTIPISKELIPVFRCESGWNPEAVGDRGERGLPQIHPIHLQEMLRQKLDFTSEQDRLVFAEQLYKEQGRRPWESSRSCWEGK